MRSRAPRGAWNRHTFEQENVPIAISSTLVFMRRSLVLLLLSLQSAGLGGLGFHPCPENEMTDHQLQ